MQIYNSFNKEIRFDTLFSMQNMETFSCKSICFLVAV